MWPRGDRWVQRHMYLQLDGLHYSLAFHEEAASQAEDAILLTTDTRVRALSHSNQEYCIEVFTPPLPEQHWVIIRRVLIAASDEKEHAIWLTALLSAVDFCHAHMLSNWAWDLHNLNGDAHGAVENFKVTHAMILVLAAGV